VGPSAGLDGCGKSRLYWVRSPDRTARSGSLYRLSYSGPLSFSLNLHLLCVIPKSLLLLHFLLFFFLLLFFPPSSSLFISSIL